MASNIFYRLLGRRRRRSDDDNSTEKHQRQESPSNFGNQSRILEIQRAEREALISQTERLCATVTRCSDAVLERLGLFIQQDPLSSPQPPAGPRRRPESSVPGQRIRPLRLPPLNVEVAASRTQKNLRNPKTIHEEEEDVHLGNDRTSSLSGSISSVDTQTPNELREISLIESPLELSPVAPSHPPAAPQLRRRVSRLPVMWMNLSGADKEVAGGYRLQTAKHQVEEIQKGLENYRQKSIQAVPRPPAAPKRNQQGKHVTPSRRPTLAPQKKTAVCQNSVQPVPRPPAAPKTCLQGKTVAPAPPLTLAPPKKTGICHGTTQQSSKAVIRVKKQNKSKLQTADKKPLEELQPLSKPVEGLSQCFKLLSLEDWKKKIEGLRTVQALAQHHPDTLMEKLHEVCLAVIEEVKNLRSSVACVAMDTMGYLYVYLQKDMDTQAERTGRTLLQKIAQSNANLFVQQQANKALEALAQNCSPARVLTTLLNNGLSHLSAAVRACTAQQLHLLADGLGAAAIFTAGRTFTQSFLTAVSKMSLDAAAEVRPHGHAILQNLALHRDFMDLWRDIVSEKDRSPLERILRTAKKT